MIYQVQYVWYYSDNKMYLMQFDIIVSTRIYKIQNFMAQSNGLDALFVWFIVFLPIMHSPNCILSNIFKVIVYCDILMSRQTKQYDSIYDILFFGKFSWKLITIS